MGTLRRIVVTCAVAVSWALVAASPATAAGTTPGVAPPSAAPHGASYADWSSRWWTWAYQTPATGPDGEQHLFLADVGTPAAPAPVDCSYAQTGRVWFLTGTFQPSGADSHEYFANRSCSVPAGTALLVPVVNSEWDFTGVDDVPDDPAEALQQLRDLAAADMDAVTSMSATIDGRPVQGLTGPGTAYRVQSGPFSYTLPAGNLFGLPAGTTTASPGAVADGVFLFVHPLSVGTHVLHWEAVVGDPQDPDFAQDITYTITVAPRR